ncbi:papain-like cysteine protease family protein, partial [Ralstonia sp. SM1872_UCD532_TZ19]
MFRLRHVPYVAQGSERTGCWYACARMLGHSVEAGPRLGVPELFNPESGHSHLQHLHDVERFIANEGLSKVSLPSSREFTHEQLGALLESPRESRRLQLLREWSHEQDEQVLT